MRRILFVLSIPFLLAACGAEPVWAPDADVKRAAFRYRAPPSITVMTVISNRSNTGAHSALLINASQRVMFDPAGTFHHPQLPEQNDVIYGMQPKAVDFYIDYHARETFRVVTQKVPVSAAVAELALARVQEYGAVPKAYCTIANTTVLSRLPGFEDVPRSFDPRRLMKYIDTKPNVVRNVIYDDSPARNGSIVAPVLAQ